MKIRVTFKDPDGVFDSVREAAQKVTSSLIEQEQKEEEIYEKISKWVRHSEYLTVEIDTDVGTAAVVPAK